MGIINSINFYVNEASPEFIESRRAYLGIFLLRLERGMKIQESWPQAWKEEEAELIEAYARGAKFLRTVLFNDSSEPTTRYTKRDRG